MSDERIEVPRTIDADAHTIFEVLRDPQGHVRIDSSGMLMAATARNVFPIISEQALKATLGILARTVQKG